MRYFSLLLVLFATSKLRHSAYKSTPSGNPTAQFETSGEFFLSPKKWTVKTQVFTAHFLFSPQSDIACFKRLL